MADEAAERDKRLLRLSVGKGLIDEATARQAWASARARNESAATVLVAEGHLTEQLATRLGEEAERAAGPQRIAGFVVERKLGQGGMGAVYLARQESIGRQVALKVLSPAVAGQPGIADRFVREARAAGSVNHPNVVAIHDAGTHQGRVYMALEFVPGGDAEGLMRAAGGRLPEVRALRVVADAARGLQAVHVAGLIHRDIKPANIFIAADGTAKLGDLGLARSEGGDDRMTATGAAVGTPAFMSPEQANGDPRVDIRSDIYALGATLFALIAGRPPYLGATVWQVVDQVMHAPPPDAAAHGAGPAVARVIARAMAKDPASRQQTPHALLEEVLAALADGSATSRPRLSAPASPRRAWTVLAVAGAAALVAGGWALASGAGDAAAAAASPAAAAPPSVSPSLPASPTVALERQRLARLTPVQVQAIPAGRQDGARWGFGIGRFGSEGLPIIVQGAMYPDGLAVHPPADATPSRLVYDLGGAWGRLTGQAAINDSSDFVVQGRRGNHSPLHFVILGDGRELWRSRPVNTFDPPQTFAVAVDGVRSLELRVEIEGVFHCCQAVWLDPELSR